jgi:hypothetical protein
VRPSVATALGLVLLGAPGGAGEVELSPYVTLSLPDHLTAYLYPGYGDALAIVELFHAESGEPFASGAVEEGPDFECAPDPADLAVLLAERFPSLRPESLLDVASGGAGDRLYRLEVHPKGGFYTCRIVGAYYSPAGCFLVDFAATAPRAEALEALAALDFLPGG